MSYTDITSDGGMDPRNDPQSDSARLTRHRALFNVGLPPHPEVIEKALRNGLTSLALALSQQQRDTAIRHLHALLNTRRTATQAWEAEGEAREWLESIGSEAP